VSFTGHSETITALAHVGTLSLPFPLVPSLAQSQSQSPKPLMLLYPGPGSGLFLSSSLDRTVRLWNFMKRQPVAQFYTVSPVWGVRPV
jgi:WD40 repeat protein